MLSPIGALDPRTRRYIAPTRVVWQSAGVNVEPLLQSTDPQTSLWRPAACKLEYTDHAPGFLLDFGRELHGGLAIIVRSRSSASGLGPGATSSSARPVRLRVRFGESVSEAMGEPVNDHGMHDFLCEVAWGGSVEVGPTGFRFVRIDLVDPGASVALQAVLAVSLMREIEPVGSFSCSDKRLNAIWQTGARTVHLCMQDYLWDGIKRDRLVWMGDMHPEIQVIGRVFGNDQIVPESLDWARNEFALPGFMNGIPSYSMWWVIAQRDWFYRFADRGYLREQREYLLGLLERLAGFVGEDGQEHLPERRFLDWGSANDKTAIDTGLHALLALALSAGAELCGELSEAETGQLCRSAADQLAKHTPPTISKQANALCVLAGLADARETNAEILARDPLRGFSPFYGYYVLEARAKAGDYAGCLEAIRRFWGGMLDFGATSFWEHFDLDWTENASRIDELVPEGKRDIHKDCGEHCYVGLRHSLCHGWSGGPTAWLSDHVLGVRPVTPGFAQVTIDPHLCDLEWAEGAVPTPHGPIDIRHERQPGGTINSEIGLPEGVALAGNI
ncbi:MAG TPA: alpha-L-rhamnosidase C-terminal domain-containing protein [Capsulimonadaceae bacterium]|nr:alpha-L-rhamnosidase C-terminal domain-containing protein [Capsulimonadaceae bacterium]